MRTKTLSLAAGALLLSAGAASAATITDNLNLRSGPGINYSVIGWMPVGSDVSILGCGRSWCRVATWSGAEAYASRRYISFGGPVYAGGVVAPDAYGYAWAPAGGYGRWNYRYNRHHWYWYP